MNIKNNRDRIIYLLKTRGPQTAVTVADELGMTSMGARQLLKELAKVEVVDTFTAKASRGRPKQVWQLTEQAHARFPDRHADVIVDLLSATKAALGDEGIELLIKARETQMQAKYVEFIDTHRSLSEQVRQLAKIRSTEGYMAEVIEDDTGLYLVENHCPICVAAQSCQQFCRSELDLFKQILNVEVKRVEYLLSGDRRCVYQIG